MCKTTVPQRNPFLDRAKQFDKIGNAGTMYRTTYEDQYRIGAVLDATGSLIYRFVYGSKLNVPDYMIKSGTKYKLVSIRFRIGGWKASRATRMTLY